MKMSSPGQFSSHNLSSQSLPYPDQNSPHSLSQMEPEESFVVDMSGEDMAEIEKKDYDLKIDLVRTFL